MWTTNSTCEYSQLAATMRFGRICKLIDELDWNETRLHFGTEFPLVTGLSLALFQHGRFLVGREGWCLPWAWDQAKPAWLMYVSRSYPVFWRWLELSPGNRQSLINQDFMWWHHGLFFFHGSNEFKCVFFHLWSSTESSMHSQTPFCSNF